jgi:hypothetical protein
MRCTANKSNRRHGWGHGRRTRGDGVQRTLPCTSLFHARQSKQNEIKKYNTPEQPAGGHHTAPRTMAVGPPLHPQFSPPDASRSGGRERGRRRQPPCVTTAAVRRQREKGASCSPCSPCALTSPLVAPAFELWHRPQACLCRREPVLGPARSDQRREVASAAVARPRVPPPSGACPRAGESGSGGGRTPPPLSPVLGSSAARSPSSGWQVRIRRREAASAPGSPSSGRRRPFSASSAAESPVPGPASADPAEGCRLRPREPVLGSSPPVLGFLRRREPCPWAGERGSGGGRPPPPPGACPRAATARPQAASAGSDVGLGPPLCAADLAPVREGKGKGAAGEGEEGSSRRGERKGGAGGRGDWESRVWVILYNVIVKS